MQSSDERKAILNQVSKQVDSFIDFSYQKAVLKPETDQVADYAKQVLSLGFFYLEFCDPIREGGGERVVRCWHYLLPIFAGSGRKNYCAKYALPTLLWTATSFVC